MNTTFGNLKINSLRKAGNNYNATDATRLLMAGGIINDVISTIFEAIKGHPFTLDTGNTVNTVAATASVALVDTNIVEILEVYQKTTNSKLRFIPYTQYVNLVPNASILGGVPECLWSATQTVDVSGNNIWTLYFVPTPSSIVAVYYDYIKNGRFSSDSTTADAEFSPLPSSFDHYIYDMAKPLIYEIIAPDKRTMIADARNNAVKALADLRSTIMSPANAWSQGGSARDQVPFIYKRVATTPIP